MLSNTDCRIYNGAPRGHGLGWFFPRDTTTYCSPTQPYATSSNIPLASLFGAGLKQNLPMLETRHFSCENTSMDISIASARKDFC